MKYRSPETNRIYARVANFPVKLGNLQRKLAELQAEATDLGFREEANILGAMATFANCLPEHEPKKVDWTPDEVTQLKRYWIEGLTLVEIGKRVGRTSSAVSGAARRLNLPVRKRGKRAR